MNHKHQRLSIAAAIVSVIAVGSASASIQVFHTDEEYLLAAGTAHVINFVEQPDGLPSVDGVSITPDFNYGSAGARFAAGRGDLFLAADDQAGFVLRATVSSPEETWIDGELSTPSTAVAILYGDATTLSVFDIHGMLIGTAIPEESGFTLPRHDDEGFLGIVSDVPIASVRISRGLDHEEIAAFLYTPIPEPASSILIVIGMTVFHSARRKSGL